MMDMYVTAFPELAPFWRASEQGRFLLPQCERCKETHWYPRAHCPHCHAASLVWIHATGRGELYSYSMNRKSASASIIAFVKLEEGPILMTELVDCTLEDAHIGLALCVDFKTAPEGRRVPVFRPADAKG